VSLSGPSGLPTREEAAPYYFKHIDLIKADRVAWADHVEGFRVVRLGTLSFFRTLPKDAWARRGIASDNPFTVRALAYLAAGHLEHHVAILQERYREASR
jgi:hypothetical protein